MIVERASVIIETITISPARGRLQIMSVSLSDFLSMSSPLQLMKQLSPPFHTPYRAEMGGSVPIFSVLSLSQLVKRLNFLL